MYCSVKTQQQQQQQQQSQQQQQQQKLKAKNKATFLPCGPCTDARNQMLRPQKKLQME